MSAINILVRRKYRKHIMNTHPRVTQELTQEKDSHAVMVATYGTGIASHAFPF